MPFWFVQDDDQGRRARKSQRKDERRMWLLYAFIIVSIVTGLVLLFVGV